MAVSVDQVMEAYVKTRDELAAKKKEFDASVAELKDMQSNREKWLLGQLTTQDVESIKAAHGTCFIKWAESVTVADGEVFMSWVKADWDNRKHFLENRCSKGAVKQDLDDKKPLPPGINYNKVKTVRVRRK